MKGLLSEIRLIWFKFRTLNQLNTKEIKKNLFLIDNVTDATLTHNPDISELVVQDGLVK
jgi:hypothetical protein